MENINESSIAAGAGAFSFIMDSIKDIKKFLDERQAKRNNSGSLTSSSIMNASKDLVMSFPRCKCS